MKYYIDYKCNIRDNSRRLIGSNIRDCRKLLNYKPDDRDRCLNNPIYCTVIDDIRLNYCIIDAICNDDHVEILVRHATIYLSPEYIEVEHMYEAPTFKKITYDQYSAQALIDAVGSN